MSRILIVEDNKDLAFGLCSNLEIEGYDVATAATGKEGIQKARAYRPDLVILDLMLPEMDGFEVLQALRADSIETPVLILTARGEEVDKVRGLRLGADDYVTKPFGLMELLARVEAILRRSGNSTSHDTNPQMESIHIGDIEVCPKTRTVLKNARLVELAPKEFDLLLELIRHGGAVVSRIDLMKTVWGHSSTIVSRTVDTHIAELRRKIGDDSSHSSLIVTVRKAGYRIAM
jgi:DNA-binding response OmpR family regulator